MLGGGKHAVGGLLRQAISILQEVHITLHEVWLHLPIWKPLLNKVNGLAELGWIELREVLLVHPGLLGELGFLLPSHSF